MPAITSSEVGVALDMHGCPNRCRHCYLGRPHAGRVGEEDLQWVVRQFRTSRRSGEEQPLWQGMRVSSWVWEPDYSPEYRRLYELENELSNLPSLRAEWELLSVWRLARDPEYAEWAYSIGLRVCQISFFGMEKATDWGYGRRGAFRDALIATERLLAAGIRPRWQWFFTRRILPDLPGLIELMEELRLRERCEALSGPFTLFLHCPSPDGEAWNLEHLRPTESDLQYVPTWLREQSERHIGQLLGEPEARLCEHLRKEDKPTATTIADLTGGNDLWFMIMADFDVYPNAGEMSAAWRLGHLKRDGLAAVLDVFENDRAPGLWAAFHVPVSELARRFGRPRSQHLYTPADLKSRWVHMWAAEAQKAAFCRAGVPSPAE